MGDVVRAAPRIGREGSRRPRESQQEATTATMQDRSQFRPAAAVTLAILLVCGMMAMAFVVEVDVEEDNAQPVVLADVKTGHSKHFHAGKARGHARFAKMYKKFGMHEDAAKHAALAKKHAALAKGDDSKADDPGTWLARVKKSQKHLKVVSDVRKATVQHLKKHKKEAIDARQDAADNKHDNNNLRRQDLRDAGRRAAKKMVSKAIDAMTANVRSMASTAAKKAAGGIVSKTASARAKAAHKRNMSAKAKLAMLEKDVAPLEAAEKRALNEAKQAKMRFQAKDAKYKAIVNAKVLRAQQDFEKMKLAAYKGAKRKERLTAERLRRLAQEVVRLSARLKRERAHVAHLQAMLKKRLAKFKAKMDKKRKNLMKMIKR